MRLVDADKIEPHEQFEALGNGKYEFVRVAYMDDIDALPTVDAVPVVRCGECKYLMPDNHCTMFADDRIRPSGSDFCSAGERKDGDHD